MIEDREDIKQHMAKIAQYAANANVTVEIGPDMGNGSTRAIGWAYDGYEYGLWITVDIDDHILPECRPTHKDWRMVVGDSRSISTMMLVKSMILESDRAYPSFDKADLIFIDTIHEKEFLATELGVWKEIADDDTIWLFHDTWMLGQYNTMTDAIKEFAQKNPQWYYVDLSKENNGLGALLPIRMEPL